LREEARSDVLQAFEWYEERRAGLGIAATGLIGDHFHRPSGEPVPARNST